MKPLKITTLLALLTLNVISGEIIDGIEVGISGKHFYSELQSDTTECYLVTIYKATTGKNHLRKPQLDFKATIVGIVKGERKIGDKITFDRVSDGGFRNGSEYEGEMYYVFYYKAPMNGSPIQGQFYIDPQDPLSMFKYTNELAKIASLYKQKNKNMVNSSVKCDSEGG